MTIPNTSSVPFTNELGTRGANESTKSSGTSAQSTTGTGSSSLNMDDFYQLLASQIQNQDMNNPMDSSQFMNQMMQMAVMQSIETFTDTSVTQYAASLVGKGVTVAEVDENEEVVEIFGEVTATGVYSGQQVVFVNDKAYPLSQIMAIGKLPAQPGEGEGDTPKVPITGVTGVKDFDFSGRNGPKGSNITINTAKPDAEDKGAEVVATFDKDGNGVTYTMSATAKGDALTQTDFDNALRKLLSAEETTPEQKTAYATMIVHIDKGQVKFTDATENESGKTTTFPKESVPGEV